MTETMRFIIFTKLYPYFEVYLDALVQEVDAYVCFEQLISRYYG